MVSSAHVPITSRSSVSITLVSEPPGAGRCGHDMLGVMWKERSAAVPPPVQHKNIMEYMHTTEGLKEQLLGVFIAFAMMGVVDVLFCRRIKARWMALHFLANVVVVVTTLWDLVSAADNPVLSCVGHASSQVPTHMIVALHMYHLLVFECGFDDVLHHVVFVGIIGGLGILFDVNPPVKNLIAFFMCGLPGGLDYLMLTLVKVGGSPWRGNTSMRRVHGAMRAPHARPTPPLREPRRHRALRPRRSAT